MSDTVLAIDIGSTKICAIIAEIEEEKVQVVGHGVSKSQGIKKGAITNIELASKSIKKAINDAKRIAGSNITSATVSISNAYAKSLNSTGIVNIPHKDISIKEINRVMQTALYNANVPNEYEVIHVLPYNFRVDDQDFIEDPFGMNASRMEVDVNIIMTQKSNLSNLKKAVRSAGVEIDGIVLSGYASAISVMDEDEKELGVAVIDLGGQTSNLVIHAGNSIRYNDFLGVGSNHITNDLSMALHTPLQVAENVKIRHGNLIETSNEIIELPIIGDEENRNGVSLEIVHSVIFSRVEEALMILAKSLEKSALKEQIGAGIILTGGMTKLKGIRELAQSIFPAMPVRIAKPKEVEGLFDELKDPAFATVIGLVLYKAGKHTPYEINFNQEMLHSKAVHHENLRDIDLSSPEHTPAQPEKEKSEIQKEESEPSTITFDDLPDIGKENSNPIKKFANWAKQLF
ncbi:cell division protein FtsA [Sulfurovum sp. ST-21]|uniref:Cell division protein FtsA n=1 Tax=Sulfurovum indicum TaxID=2779528 RepID=A0A7M1S2X3_9BACT|nr:cell division protein FtsA [Sulfurovum indicum]QOR61351.1 cell division protein FtsA [Sulfurovum indicum]